MYDPAPAAPHQSRAGVPQFRMPHGLLIGGLQALASLFPGFKGALVAAGGIPIDWGVDCDFRDMGVAFARGPSSVRSVCGSRALFEHVVRACLLAGSPGVQLRLGAPVTGLQLERHGDEAVVTGVHVRGEPAPLAADLVVDASGRNSRVATWLADALPGWTPPRELRVDAHVGYATRIYRIPEGYAGPKAVLCGTRPDGTRSGLLAPIEGGRWNVVLTGYAGDHPPTDDAGFLAWAATLPAASMAQAMAAAQPLGPVETYRQCSNQRRLWEEAVLPQGLCVLGDAVLSPNPVFGQGMTVAALECLALRDMLRQRLRGADDARSSNSAPHGTTELRQALAGFGAEFQVAVAGIVEAPWQLATGEDLAFAGTDCNFERPPPPPPMMPRYMQALALAASRDPGVCASFCRVMHMADAPAALMQGDMVGRVVALAGAGYEDLAALAQGGGDGAGVQAAAERPAPSSTACCS